MDQEAIIQYVINTFTGVEVARPADGPGAGDTFFFYDPQHNLSLRRPWRNLAMARRRAVAPRTISALAAGMQSRK